MRAGRSRLLLLLLLWAPAAAQACMFLKDVPMAEWHRWASSLFVGEVLKLEREGDVDLIQVRVTETLKGPQGDIATVRMPVRMWNSCRLERPAPGMQVLVAFNANGDAAVVPTNGAREGASGGAARPQ